MAEGFHNTGPNSKGVARSRKVQESADRDTDPRADGSRDFPESEIEKATRAIFAQLWPSSDYDFLTDQAKDLYRSQAHAALSASGAVPQAEHDDRLAALDCEGTRADEAEASLASLRTALERLCVALDYAYVYLPSADESDRHAEEYRSVIGRRFPKFAGNPILSREDTVRLTNEVRALAALDGSDDAGEPCKTCGDTRRIGDDEIGSAPCPDCSVPGSLPEREDKDENDS